jgi:hypothetical protein
VIAVSVAKHPGACQLPGVECDVQGTWVVDRRSNPKGVFRLQGFKVCPGHVAEAVTRMMTVEALANV